MRHHPNDGLFDFLDKAGTFVLANLLWVLLSIPVITVPLTTAGLFATMSRWVQGQPVEVFRDFFGGMRRHWRKASLMVLLDVLLGGFILVNLSIFQRMNPSQPLTVLSQSVTLFAAVTAIMVNLYLWPLMVTFEELPLRRLLDTALKLVFAHPLGSVALLFMGAAPLILSLMLPGAFFALATFSTMAFLVSWGAWRIIRRYAPEEQRSAISKR